MNIDIKKVLATAAAAGLVLATPVTAFAASDASASVGDDGESYSYSDDSDNLSVDNSQHGNVANLDLGVGVSGLNSQNDNDDDNGVATGDAEGFAGSDNFVNSNVSLIEDADEGSSTSDATVGEDGNAWAYAYDNDEVTVENDNCAYLENLTLGAGVSGLNSQNGNDDENQITTGDSHAEALAWNEVNSNWTTIGGSHSGNAMAHVEDDGDAYAFAEDNDSVTVENRNSAYVSNASVAAAVSGGNSQSWNDDNNSINTGYAHANSDASNFVNSNVTVVGGEAGNGSAQSTSNVGEDGNANSYAYDNDEVTVENSNNANVENASVAVGVSGGNTQSGNDDGNNVTTGSASGSSCSTNTVNSNWTVIGGSLPEGGSAGCN